MLRLHFTAADLARVRIAMLGPLAETELALRNLQQRDRRAMFDNWRAQTGPRMSADGRDLARFLARPPGGLVDLFSLTGPATDIGEAIDLLRSVPRGQLLEEFTCHPGIARRRAPWLGRILEPDRAAIERMTQALVQCHEVTIAPYWDRIHHHLQTETALLGQLIARNGLVALLGRLHPMLQWKASVLEIPGYRPWQGNTDVHLAGRDLVLAPSVFCGSAPHLFAPPHGEEVLLIYPALHDLAAASAIWAAPTRESSDSAPVPKPLIALLGRTRAIVLTAIADHALCTTTQLATYTRVSLASASEHATVLRRAGLTTLTRDHKHVRHSISPAGLALLNTTAAT
ncbi:winged helix-turn-helix domain-containing protein [Streptomyces sp. NPDC101115]|uniref:winged helix-turn-helix domain-containing protein n=1 Tax=Streptomyces sp. NPDC101115 TaxID=3366106 RepID=UPI00380A37F7